jgi:hypothetical protein
MKNELEVRDVIFGGLRKISSKELSESAGLDLKWEGSIDGTDVKLILFNESKEIKQVSIYNVSRADISEGTLWSWKNVFELNPDEERVFEYLIPIPGVSSFDYRDYTGPLRYAVEITISDPTQNRTISHEVKYYDLPARVDADKVEQSNFDINKALKELRRTTILHDILIEGDPKDGLKSIKAKLFNYGQETQYIGIDTRAEKGGSGVQTQFFYKLEPQQEILADICPVKDLKLLHVSTGIEHLEIRMASIPELAFKSESGRGLFLYESFEKDYNSVIAKIDYYFS